jgi:hypothetical protein
LPEVAFVPQDELAETLRRELQPLCAKIAGVREELSGIRLRLGTAVRSLAAIEPHIASIPLLHRCGMTFGRSGPPSTTSPPAFLLRAEI